MDNKKLNEKTYYFQRRKEKGLTRDQACELFSTISVDRLERIENNKMIPTPDDIKEMAEGYKDYQLFNYYCTHQCPIGKDYVPKIIIKALSQLVVETLVSLNQINDNKNRLLEITVDGKISNSELEDFIKIKKYLDQISITVESLKLWTEQMKSNGSIDEEEYNKLEKKVLSIMD